MTKQYTLGEALAWMVEHPMEVLISFYGSKCRYNDDTKVFQYVSKHTSDWSLRAIFSHADAPFTHPEPKREAVTLATLGRFKRVTVQWPEWSIGPQLYTVDCELKKWMPGVIGFINTALQMGLDVTGEVE